MYTSGWFDVDDLMAVCGGADALPKLEVLMASGVAVLLSGTVGTVELGLLDTVTPGGWMGCRWLLKFRFASEAPEALRCMASVIMDVAWLASAFRMML
jgi:hypothetical protein